VLGELSDGDSVESFDTHAAILRYNNLNPGELTGDSLKKYEQRTRTAIEQFVAWKRDPLNYKPPSRGLPTTGNGDKKPPVTRRAMKTVGVAKQMVAEPAPDPTPAPPVASPVATNALAVPIPIRGGKFIVQMTIPHDLSSDEAKRIGAVVLAYGHDEVESLA